MNTYFRKKASYLSRDFDDLSLIFFYKNV